MDDLLSLRSGTVIGDYVVDALVGEGGSSVVFRAHTANSREPVALKIAKLRKKETRARCRRERAILELLCHPNIVRLRDTRNLPDGRLVLVMDLLDGESLRARLTRAGPLSLSEVANVAVGISAALRHAHTSGIVHRDVKPENVWMHRARYRSATLLDFGIAKSMARASEDTLTFSTQKHALIGTPAYMAPEQIFGEDGVDARTDIWALGVVLYEAFSGVHPVVGENTAQVFKAIAVGTIVPFGQRVPDAPLDVTSLIDRMLCHSRADRVADLAEVSAVFSRYATSLDDVTNVRFRATKRLHRPMFLASAAALLVALPLAAPPTSARTTRAPRTVAADRCVRDLGVRNERAPARAEQTATLNKSHTPTPHGSDIAVRSDHRSGALHRDEF